MKMPIVIKQTNIQGHLVSTIVIESREGLVHFETVTFGPNEEQTREQWSNEIEEALFHHNRHVNRVIKNEVRWV